jgi:hypothetical protein
VAHRVVASRVGATLVVALVSRTPVIQQPGTHKGHPYGARQSRDSIVRFALQRPALNARQAGTI